MWRLDLDLGRLLDECLHALVFKQFLHVHIASAVPRHINVLPLALRALPGEQILEESATTFAFPMSVHSGDTPLLRCFARLGESA